MLTVLDGLRAIEDEGEKGTLELYFRKGGHSVLLNDSEDELLHDIFVGLVPPV
jgi:hypothetical protein